MHKLRWILPGLALAALAAGGCFLTSAQIFAHYALPTPIVLIDSSNPVQRVPVDLNTISDYADNKDKLKGLADFAVVGKFTNLLGPAGGVEIWITPGVTNYTTVSQVKTSATRLWGPVTVGATGSVHDITWDESAALLNGPGRTIAVSEAKGDGVFTIYAFGTAGTYNIRVDGGGLLLVISAGI